MPISASVTDAGQIAVLVAVEGHAGGVDDQGLEAP
jgi:hypothetical protein